MKRYKIAVLDDYQNVALESADWSVLRDRADITVFQNHLADPDAVIERLLPFDVVCAMRERTDNVLATPHIGYVSDGLYKTFYEDTVSNIRKWLDTH
jgi:lactate dehydrogenase-like 2-hydroxyacid dehydrogenase